MGAITESRAMGLTIGGLSKRTRCNIETIRYYERIGMLPPPPRTEGGHRIYAEHHLRRLVFVRRSRELGFSLEEIGVLLALVDGGDHGRGEVREIAVGHLETVRGKIADLGRLERTMTGMVVQCDGGTVPDCPVIDALFDNSIAVDT